MRQTSKALAGEENLGENLISRKFPGRLKALKAGAVCSGWRSLLSSVNLSASFKATKPSEFLFLVELISHARDVLAQTNLTCPTRKEGITALCEIEFRDRWAEGVLPMAHGSGRNFLPRGDHAGKFSWDIRISLVRKRDKKFLPVLRRILVGEVRRREVNKGEVVDAAFGYPLSPQGANFSLQIRPQPYAPSRPPVRAKNGHSVTCTIAAHVAHAYVTYANDTTG